jgi:hypothetical protein
MNAKELRQRRRQSEAIPTDEQGNLIIKNKYKVSGRKQREKCRTGEYRKKVHKDGTPVEGTYVQFNFGTPIDNKDVKVVPDEKVGE